ncbi:MAG: N-acetylmuramoyl-L-alanine amidase family 2 protein, partial [Candidatus Berkelbacteria bacterium Licking1014_96]
NLKINKNPSIIDSQIEDKLMPEATVNNEWVSEVFKANFPFDALGAQWRKDEESQIKINVRFSKDNKDWEEWQEMVVDDADQGNEKSESAQTHSFEVSDLAFSSQAQYFQYKVIFEDKIDQAYFESIIFSYINASDNSKIKTLSNLFRPSKAKAVNSPRIISRAEWGANPAYMTWSPEYVRPNKIIIHHTASGNNPPDPAAVMRSIYYYHAVSLGWGDIGYNYLFDQYGNIYEGRAGGNGVVGAHAYGQNYGSIGFSAIGEFSGVNITDATFNALTDLTAFKAYENDFDITWGTIFGHRDFNATACPGTVLYSRKGAIIDTARQKVGTYLERDRNFLNQNNNVLIKSYSQPEIYLLENGTRRHIVDPKTFALLGYSSQTINYVSLIALNEIPGGTKISALVKVQDDPKVFMVKNNPQARYWVTDPALFADFGLDWNSVIPISQSELDAISYAGPLKPVIRGINSAPVYHLSSGKKEHFADMLALEGWGYSSSDIVDLPSSFVDTYPQNPTLYNLARGDGVNVFLLQNGQRCQVPNPAVFGSFGFKWNEITDLNLDRLNALPEGPNLSRIARGSGPTVYLIDNFNKHPFPDPQTLGLWGKTPDQAFLINDQLLTRIPDGFVVTDLARSSE